LKEFFYIFPFSVVVIFPHPFSMMFAWEKKKESAAFTFICPKKKKKKKKKIPMMFALESKKCGLYFDMAQKIYAASRMNSKPQE
jgi:hypothetical protein